MRKTIAIIGLITSTAAITKVCCQTSRLTSDASKTPHGLPIPPGGIYVAPVDNVFIEFRTNLTALVVRQEVTSNVIRRTFWMSNGQRFTNDSLLTNTVILVTTNSL